MHPLRLPLRALAASLAIAAAAFAVASCGRTTRSFTPAVTGPVTWTNTVSHLLADRSEGTAPTGCTSCHHAGTGIPDWSNYNTVVADSSIIRSRLSTPGDTMRGFLKPGEPEIVIAWIDAGAPL